MRYLKVLFLTLLFVTGVENSNAQSADEIIEKYIKAVGGRERISQIKSLYVVTETKVMGMKARNKSTILYGKGIRTESEIMGTKNIMVSTDKSGWTASSRNDYKIEPVPQEQYLLGREQIFICSPFPDYAARGYKANNKGIETVKKASMIKIQMVSPDKSVGEYFFDPVSFYLVKSNQKFILNGKDVEITTNYSDYRDIGTGYKMPFTVESKYGAIMSNTSYVKEVLVNQPVDETIFIKP
jgi:hypothetical protein